ncbi:hypothetical protein T484DRAFT_1794194, partial [Baffinella frigidus]
MSGFVMGRAALSALRSLPKAAVARSSAVVRPACALTTVTPAQLLLPWWLSLGGRARSVAAGAGADALVPTAMGMGAGVCRGGDSRRLTGSRGGSSGGGGKGKKGRAGPVKVRPAELTGWITKCTDEGHLQELVERRKAIFNSMHVVAAWGTLAKMRSHKQPGGLGRGEWAVLQRLIQRLHVLTMATVPEMGEREVASVVSTLAKIHKSGRMAVDAELVAELVDRATATAGDFKPQAVSNLVWGLAKMGIKPNAVGVKPDAGLVEAMQGRATATAGDFKPQEVSNVMWGLAKMGVKTDAGLVKAMQRQATATAGDFTPQAVSNVVWGLAKMGVKPDAGLLEAMQRQARATAGDFKPQDIANLVWGLAKMGVKPNA